MGKIIQLLYDPEGVLIALDDNGKIWQRTGAYGLFSWYEIKVLVRKEPD